MLPVVSGRSRRVRAFLAWAAVGLSVVLVVASAPPALHAADPPAAATQSPGTPVPGPDVAQAAPAGAPIVLPRAGTVVATVVSASAAASSDFGLDQPTRQTLIANATFNVGATATVGTFAAGTSLVFFLFTAAFGTTYLSTGDHAQVLADGPEAWIINWEDATDFDFNDLVTRISYAPSAGPPSEQTLGTGSGAHGPSTTRKEAEPVDTATGNYVTAVTDLALPGRGLGFAFARTYNSLDPAVGPLGPGWRHGYAARIILEASGAARFVAEDGAQYLFAPDGAGGFVQPAGATSRLAAVPGGYEVTRRDQVRYRFDSGGQLTSLTDRNGNALGFAYTGGNLAAISDTVGRVVALGYDPSNRLISLADPAGRTVAYAYDAAGRLASVTDVRGGLTRYTYDAAGRLATITDQAGHVLVTNTYGADGRVVEQLDARGFRSTFAWDPVTGTSTFTDARGGRWIDVYESNKLVRQTDPLGALTSYGYDAAFNRTSVTDPRGNTTTLTYDGRGNLLTRTAPAPLSFVETYTYDAANNVRSYRDGRANTTTMTYDPAGNLRTVTGPAPVSPVTTYAYDPAGTGLLFSITDPRGKVTTFAYDARANRNRITSPLGNVTTMTYDAAGRITSLVEPRGNVTGANPADYTTTFTYDAAGDLLTVTDPLGNVTTSAYDPVGNRTSMTNALGRVTRYGYDAANHLTSVTDALGGITAYGYDATGNLVSRTDANGHLTTSEYDLAGRLTATVDPLLQRTSRTYDPAGNLATRTDANGNTTTFGYDALDRLTSITYAATTTPSVTYAYDANGNRTTMTDGAGTETYAYDALDRLTSVTRGTDTFGYGYDVAGNLLSRTYPDGTLTTYTYDDDGRLVTAVSAGFTTSYTYDPAGNPRTAATPDGFSARSSFDRAGRLLEVAHVGPAGVLSRFTYALDAAGNRLKMTTNRETHLYTYDALDRLTRVCYGSCPAGGGGGGGSTSSATSPTAAAACLDCGGLSTINRPPEDNPPAPGDTFTSWTYDPLGNRLTETNYLGTKTYTYDAADRLLSVSGPGTSQTVSYTYDRNGNQTAAGPNTFTYDLADRLVAATVGTSTETYTWAGDAVRLSARSGNGPSNTTRFIVDRSFALPQLAIERDGNDKTLRRYTYGLDLLAQTTPTKGPYWYHHDGLGSVSDVTSTSGVSLSWAEYTPYGAPRASASASQAPQNFFRFTGEYQDTSTALYHLRARQYDPASGRFLSVDPVSPALGDPYVGAYVYVGNNPVRYTDPSGQCLGPLIFLLPACIGALVGGGSYTAGVAVSNVATRQEVSLEGWNPIDFGLSAAAGAVTGGTAPVLTTGGRIAVGGIAGFDATLWSMIFGGRRDPSELIAGTVFGGFGGAVDFGSGAIGGLRGIVGGGLFNALQAQFQKLIQQAQQLLAARAVATVSGK
jgi:RHS repeat-associated protein